MTTRLILPLPPSKNRSHRQTNENGILRRRRTKETLRFARDAGWMCKAWMRESGWRQAERGRKVILRYWCYWGDGRVHDPGNMVDTLLDSLKGVAYEDDNSVLPRAMDYAIDRKRPRVEIELEEVSEHA